MINRNTERVVKPSFLPKFSDADIFKGVVNSEFWGHVFLGEKKALWIVFKGLLSLKIEMFVSPLRMTLRYNHGRRTVGIVIILLSATMMMAFNTQSFLGALSTFVPFAAPIVPFFMSWEEISSSLFTEIRSEALMVFWMAYGALSALHLMLVYLRKDGDAPPAGRGTSWLHRLVFQHFKVAETAVQRVVEPFLVGVVGYLLIGTDTDFTFGLFLIIAAACLFVQEVFDAVMQFSIT
ncbi:MAG: hypothetical protein H6577_10040 [Lewinellaceae bacterium]|nr:hypothetical protein [Saprospiraceae bacterium]MCB9338457.1 hypothetical protein [Lewinellaceae bacterium]